MPETKSARSEIQKATKKILAARGRQIAENGRDPATPDFDEQSGFWADRGKWAKPARWLLLLERTGPDSIVVSLPNNDHAKRIAGGMNTAQKIHMGVSTRVLVAVKEGGKYRLHEDFEWLLLFVFPDIPVNVAQNDATSGDTASFDPSSGELLMKDRYPQPYVIAQLFKVASNPPEYRQDGNRITYDQTTAAIVDFISVNPCITVKPLEPLANSGAIKGILDGRKT
jgi:hypothetical protein